MPEANLTGRFETHMWYITEPSRTKDIGGKFAVKKKIGPAGAWDQAGGLLSSYRPFPGLCFVPEAISSGRGRSESGLSSSGLVPPRPSENRESRQTAI